MFLVFSKALFSCQVANVLYLSQYVPNATFHKQKDRQTRHKMFKNRLLNELKYKSEIILRNVSTTL